MLLLLLYLLHVEVTANQTEEREPLVPPMVFLFHISLRIIRRLQGLLTAIVCMLQTLVASQSLDSLWRCLLSMGSKRYVVESCKFNRVEYRAVPLLHSTTTMLTLPLRMLFLAITLLLSPLQEEQTTAIWVIGAYNLLVHSLH